MGAEGGRVRSVPGEGLMGDGEEVAEVDIMRMAIVESRGKVAEF